MKQFCIRYSKICRLIFAILFVVNAAVPLIICGVRYNIPILGIVTRLSFNIFFAAFLFFLAKMICRKIAKTLLTIVFSILIVANFLLQGLELYNFYMVGESFNFAFYSTMLDWRLIMEMLPAQIAPAIWGSLYVLWTTALFVINITLSWNNPENKKMWGAASVLFCALSFLVFFIGETAFGNFLRMIKYANPTDVEITLKNESEYFKAFGISTCPVTKRNCIVYDKGTQKNLVLIILESTERQFMDEQLFPGLTPNLNRLKNAEGTIWFNQMHRHAGNTAESMIETFWGMPSFPTFSSSNGIGGFNKKMLDVFISMPYIFIKSGYSWDHIQTLSLSTMGDALAEEKINTKFADELNLPINFRQRDHHLFEYAWRIFERRAEAGRPFAISISTIDAHGPDGFVDDLTLPYRNKSKYGKIQYLDAIHNCDHHLGVFIDKVLSSPAGENTVVAIMNDHPFMGTGGGILKGNRDCIFMIVNAGKSAKINEHGCQLDVPPTLLNLFGIKSNYVFPVGESLLMKPSKDYSVRIKSTLNNRSELMRYAKLKCTKKQIRTSKIFFDNAYDNILNVFGEEVPVMDSDNLFIIKLDDNSNIISARFGPVTNTTESIKIVDDALESKDAIIFIFRGVRRAATRTICQRLGLKVRPEEYGLVFKDAFGKFFVVLSPSKKDLAIDTSVKGKEKVNISDLYPTIAEHGNADFHLKDLILRNCKGTIKSNAFVVSGKLCELSSSLCFPASGDEAASFSLSIKNIGATKMTCFCGFILHDKDYLDLGEANFPYESADRVFAVAGGAEKGSSVITVYGQPNASHGLHIARHASSDGTDLPSHDLLTQKVVSVRRCGEDRSEIQLSGPLFEKIPAGEKIRIHGRDGKYFYKSIKVLPSGSTETFDFSLKRNDDNVVFSNTSLRLQKSLPRGTCFVRPFVLLRSGGREEVSVEISRAILTW